MKVHQCPVKCMGQGKVFLNNELYRIEFTPYDSHSPIYYCPYCGMKLEIDKKKVIENLVNKIFKNQLEENETIHIDWHKDDTDGKDFGICTTDYLSVETTSRLNELDEYCGIHISPSIDKGDDGDPYPYIYIELHLDDEEGEEE